MSYRMAKNTFSRTSLARVSGIYIPAKLLLSAVLGTGIMACTKTENKKPFAPRPNYFLGQPNTVLGNAIPNVQRPVVQQIAANQPSAQPIAPSSRVTPNASNPSGLGNNPKSKKEINDSTGSIFDDCDSETEDFDTTDGKKGTCARKKNEQINASRETRDGAIQSCITSKGRIDANGKCVFNTRVCQNNSDTNCQPANDTEAHAEGSKKALTMNFFDWLSVQPREVSGEVCQQVANAEVIIIADARRMVICDGPKKSKEFDVSLGIGGVGEGFLPEMRTPKGAFSVVGLENQAGHGRSAKLVRQTPSSATATSNQILYIQPTPKNLAGALAEFEKNVLIINYPKAESPASTEGKKSLARFWTQIVPAVDYGVDTRKNGDKIRAGKVPAKEITLSQKEKIRLMLKMNHNSTGQITLVDPNEYKEAMEYFDKHPQAKVTIYREYDLGKTPAQSYVESAAPSVNKSTAQNK